MFHTENYNALDNRITCIVSIGFATFGDLYNSCIKISLQIPEHVQTIQILITMLLILLCFSLVLKGKRPNLIVLLSLKH